MIDDYQAAIVIGLVLLAFFSILWALQEIIKRHEAEQEARNLRKELAKYKKEKHYEEIRTNFLEIFEESKNDRN